MTLNDPVYAEASEALANRMMKASTNLHDRIQFGARLVLSRELTENELATMPRLYAKASDEPKGARFVRASAEIKENSGKNETAMTAVASVLLNLDAALTR